MKKVYHPTPDDLKFVAGNAQIGQWQNLNSGMTANQISFPVQFKVSVAVRDSEIQVAPDRRLALSRKLDTGLVLMARKLRRLFGPDWRELLKEDL